MLNRWTLPLTLIAVLALLVLVVSTGDEAYAYIPENDNFPEPCDGPCMGTNDICCNPSYDPGGDGGGGTGGTCAGYYCQHIPDGPDGQPGFNYCAVDHSFFTLYNECTEPVVSGGECTLSDLCWVQ